MGEQVTFPLSGDVSQWFNIFTDFNRNGQIGLFNIELGDSSDPALEHELLAKVGSYGRQIGQLTDMVAVLRKLVPAETIAKLDREDRLAIELFDIQAQMVDLIKRGQDIATAQAAARAAREKATKTEAPKG